MSARAGLIASVVAAAAFSADCGKDFRVDRSASDLRARDVNSDAVRIRGLPDEDVGELARFSRLEYINFGGGWKAMPMKLTAAGFERIAELDLPDLSAMNLAHISNLDDECLRQVGRLRGLTTVSMNGSTGFTRGGLAHVTALPKLAYLDLRGCPQVDEGWIETLAAGRTLQLGVTATGMSADGVARLRAALPECHVDDEPAFIDAALDRALYPGWAGPPERKGR